MADIIRRGKRLNKTNISVDNFRYWDDTRWEEVRRLRKTGDAADTAKADELEKRIKKHWKAE